MRVTRGLLLSLGLLGRCSAALQDAQGLQFADAGAFCAFHCSSTLLSPSAQCSKSLCGHRRALQDATDQQIDVISCNSVEQNASALEFALTLSAADSAQVFQGLHDAFFQAYDAMLGGDSITADACQLAFLQDKLLPTVQDDDSQQEEDAERKPRLVKLLTGQEERACVAAVRGLWAQDETNETPLLTRRGDRLGENTVLLVHANESVAEEIRALECVDVMLNLPEILKLMPFARSAAQLSGRMRMSTRGNASVAAPAMEIRLVQGAALDAVMASLEQRASEEFGLLNVFETRENWPRSIFTKPLQDLRTWMNILALTIVESSVEWLDERHELTQNLLRGEDQERWTRMQSHRRLDEFVPSLVGVDPAREAGIRGNDVVVGITDTGLYLYHDQFDQDERDIFSGMVMSARKVVMYNAWANKEDEAETITCGHGTHIAGLLAGSSFSGKHADLGIADKSRIAFMDIGTQSEACAGQLNCAVSLSTPADAGDLLKSQMDAGAKIFSFSWGTPGSDYSSQARDLDAFINENPDVLVVVAAGNSGETTITGQRTISSPSGAKNVISVGASLNSASTFAQFGCPNVFNEHTVAAFSSAGPTTDGRLKPDVVAPGDIASHACGHRCRRASLRVAPRWLVEKWPKRFSRMGALPSSGIASCTSLTSDAIDVKFPDVYQGYGKPNLTNIIYFSGSSGSGSGNGTDALPSLYFLPNSSDNSEPSVAHGGEMIISFTVARDVDLRATVVWTDPPGSTQATSQLQHDLDLIVRVRNGTKTFGPLTADSSTGRDSKNNVEMVLVSYADLLAAAGGNSSSSGDTSDHVALGNDGEIMVEAVVYGRSVLLADVQKFAFVASSSAIGSTSGSGAATTGKSFWSEWFVAIIVGSVILLLILIALCTRWCHGRGKSGQSARHLEQYPVQTTVAGAAYYPACVKSTTSTTAPDEDRCPYCPFRTPDSVLMVAHVESVHVHETNEPDTIAVLGGSRIFGLEPAAPAPNPDAPPATNDKQQCPHCRFVAPDAVILVNHVQHIHGLIG
ncbi:hypothetical protein PF005_g6726 [Phytophthora fragariae]|uniref:subtilisin n=1 Tax=Phytophthora fragariae TaxID=53985 RepID=A0A6A3YSX6_9STRA|nr:hypothetical protein PF010_g5515 [Phytophthora fragariae]KAE9222347.1 hypothetical protein PF005_g6726 [Phytophthora fragariae]KAE9244337.1 hypothetical protein PF004_g5721 [Phytophthora fragariae]